MGDNMGNFYHTILPTICIKIKNENYFLLLDPCATESYMDQKMLNELKYVKIPPIELSTHTIGGIHNKVYERALVTMPPIKHKLIFQIKNNLMELEGFPSLDLTFLENSNHNINEIRFNIPKSNVPLRGIIGADVLPSVYKPGWLFSSPIVGNSVFGAFIFGTIPTRGNPSYVSSPHSVSSLVSSRNKSFQLAMEIIINNYFELDNTKEHEKNMSLNQINAEQIFLRDIKYHKNFYYTSPLFNPLIATEHLQDYMTSFETAKSHYKRLVNRLQRADPNLLKLYHETFRGHISRGEFVKLNQNEILDPSGNFVTSVLVYKPERVKSKLRICWNLSLKNKNGKSINQTVLSGCNLIKNLLSHIMRLRQGRYLVLSDIEKAFLRIKYLEEFGKYFKILYSENLNEAPKLYKITAVLFGLVSSPFILNRTLLYHIERVMAEQPELTQICIKLYNSFYLDDFGNSFDSIEEAKIFVQKAIKILELGNFRLTQWVSSDPEILKGLDSNLIKPLEKDQNIDLRTGTSMEEVPNMWGSSEKIIEFGGENHPIENPSVKGLKCLGISYNPINDKFFFEKEKLQKISEMKVDTKRDLLKCIPRLFDPIHLISPLILRGRMIFSEVCSKIPKLDWDSKLEGNSKSDVETWKSIIPLCHKIKVSRWIPFPKNKENCYIIVAGDGGNLAFGARAFILIPKSQLLKGTPHGNIYLNDTLIQRPGSEKDSFASFYILSKIKVVSKSAKNWTSQKSELRGAVLAAELASYLAELYGINQKNCLCLLDSQATLCWLNTKVENLSLFHSNNVRKILSHNIRFGYINTKDNFSDLLTKHFDINHWLSPKTDTELNNFYNFWLGPKNFNKDAFLNYPKFPHSIKSTDDSYLSGLKKSSKVLAGLSQHAINTNINSLTITRPKHSPKLLDRFSSLDKCLGVVALVLRGAQKFLCKRSAPAKTSLMLDILAFDNLEKFSSVSEKKLALNQVIKEAQINHFAGEYLKLTNKEYVGDDSKLKAFNPGLNDIGQLVAITRLDNLDADLQKLIAINPIILPPNEIITAKIIMNIHLEYKHSNIKTTLSLLRSEFVLVHARKTVKKVLKNCSLVNCRLPHLVPYEAKMASLPKLRVQNPLGKESYNYKVVSLDLLGPYLTTLYYKGRKLVCTKCKKVQTNEFENVSKNDIKIDKTWVLLLHCLYSGHVSLEPLMGDHSTEKFLRALQKIFNRQGKPDFIISDAGGEFVSGLGHLKQLSDHLQNLNLKYKLGQSPLNIKFHIATYAPWSVNIEHMVRMVKNSLNKTLLRSKIHCFFNFQEALTHAEKVVNMRPLTYLADDASIAKDEDVILTPFHLLQGRPYKNFTLS